MDQNELNEIWRKHEAGESLGGGMKANKSLDGDQQISDANRTWARKSPDDLWENVPSWSGNLDPDKTEG